MICQQGSEIPGHLDLLQFNAANSVCYSDFSFNTFLIFKINEIKILTFDHQMAPTTENLLTIILGMVYLVDSPSFITLRCVCQKLEISSESFGNPIYQKSVVILIDVPITY